jgi:hypothetical protein
MASVATQQRGGIYPIGLAAGLCLLTCLTTALIPARVSAQSGPPGLSGAPPSAQAGSPGSRGPQRGTPPPSIQPRPSDLMNLRDRFEPAADTEAPPGAPSRTALACVANCEGVRGTTVTDQPEPLRLLLSQIQPLTDAASPTAVTRAAALSPAVEPPAAIITCVAGCYGNDARTMRATGGPPPAVLVTDVRHLRSTPTRIATTRPTPTVAATPAPIGRIAAFVPLPAEPAVAPAPVPARAPVVTTAALPLKAAIAPHQRRAATRTSARSMKARPASVSAKPSSASAAVAKAAPVVARAVAPTPSAPTAKAAPTAERRTIAAAAPKKAVVGTDWFNRINQERLAKATAKATAGRTEAD